MTQSMNYKQLAAECGVGPDTIRHIWSELPHFFVGTGRNLKSARFCLTDVLTYLKCRDYGGDEIQDTIRNLAIQGQVQTERQDLPQGRVHITQTGSRVDHRQADPAGIENDKDEFGLLDGLK